MGVTNGAPTQWSGQSCPVHDDHGSPMNRRHFLQTTLVTALAGSVRAAGQRPPRVLLRSSWQVVNIGDIAHTPGVLALLEKHIPEAEVILWASGDLSPEVDGDGAQALSQAARSSRERSATDGKASNAGLADAVAWADFLLHGSGPSLVAAKDVAAFVNHTGKPFGVYGITHGSFSRARQGVARPGEVRLLPRLRFAGAREAGGRGLSHHGVRPRRRIRLRPARRCQGHRFPPGEWTGGGQVPLLPFAPALHALLACKTGRDEGRETPRPQRGDEGARPPAAARGDHRRRARRRR